jgi:apolipoprotein N-acyltransferase
LALGWVWVEFCLRPVGLEHGLLAGTQGDGMLIRVVGSFAGYAIVAFLVAYINASLLAVLHEVRACLTVPRLVAAMTDDVRRVAVADAPFLHSRILCISQPRAPPAR